MIRFAVVIPTFRRPAFLADAIDSVLRQSYPAAEVVVVCDGPGSSLPEGIERGPVRVVEQPHAGVAAARNAGIAATTAPWVCFLDDDDLWHPDRLLRTGAYLERHPDCLALTTPSWSFAPEPTSGIDIVAEGLPGCLEATTQGRPVTDMSYLNITGRSFELLLERNRGNINGSTVQRDVLVRAGCFPEGLTCAEDWMMFLNVARYTEWDFLDERLSFVRRHPGNNTTSNPTNGLMTIEAIRQVWAETSLPSPPHRPLSAYGVDYRWTVQNAVWDSLMRGNIRIAATTLRKGFRLLPRTRDRGYVLVPPPVAWRIERWLSERGS